MRRGVASEIGRTIRRHPRVAAAWVFGSVARGDARPDSDLDIAVLLSGGQGPGDARALYALAAELERFSPSGRVDLVVLGPQGPVFRHRVLAEGVLVHDGDPEERHEFEERTFREYLDWKPTHDIAMRSTFTGLRERFARRSER
ncbi:MAG TPA: nucleotidyltransferase domain-containing protein [Sandaracinaceae bacterium]